LAQAIWAQTILSHANSLCVFSNWKPLPQRRMSNHLLTSVVFVHALCVSSVRADVPSTCSSTVLGHELDHDALAMLQTAKPRSLGARDEKTSSISRDDRASFITTQMDCSDCSGTEIPRGATWCELNPVSMAIAGPAQPMQAILACLVDEESPQQKTEQNCCPHSLFMSVTTNKSTPSPAGEQLSEHWPDYFNPALVLYNGQKKRLWDRQYAECNGGEEDADPEDFLYVKWEGQEMWFKWGSNSTPTGVPTFGGGTQEYVYVNPMMAKSFNAGMRQPVIRSDYGAVFVLQSYLTEQQDSNGSWVPTFPGCTTDPGLEEDICDYFLSCCHSLPPTWHAECGYLESTVNCGKSSCQGNVTVDDVTGAWCQVQDGDHVDVCGSTYGEATCGCPGTPPCGELAETA